jgi:ElaB/YqjD/DUF883 family membrane-anchored ribosome-binding protein
MPDPVRNDFADPQPPGVQDVGLDTQTIDELLAGFPPPERSLPRSENPRLNHAAESIGSALGTTVGRMRNGLSVVYDRQREMSRSVSQKVSAQAESLTSSISQRAGELGDLTQEKASELLDATQQRLATVRERGRIRFDRMRRQAVGLREEHPLELIGAFAAAGFALGVALRIWRSSND